MTRPKCATDKRFRSACRDKLIELGQAPGLAVRAELEGENAILVFPRLGHEIRNRNDLMVLHWYHVDDDLVFTRMPKCEVESFLNGLIEA